MLQMGWLRFRRHPGAIGSVVFLALISITVSAASLSPYDPSYNSIHDKLQPPSFLHPFGTDMLGRDVLTRVLYGGRLSLLIGIGAMLVSLAIGVPIGMSAGFFGGVIDSVLMRITDVFLAFPALFVLILFSAFLREANSPLLSEGQPAVVILSIGVLSWMALARIVRAQVLSLKEMDFITAAHSMGASNWRIFVRHLLPNIAGPIFVASTLQFIYAILTESGLSFIGFGIHPRTPTWGNMLGNAQYYMFNYLWVPFFPGLMIVTTIIAINYIGDGLRDALDPYSYRDKRGREW